MPHHHQKRLLPYTPKQMYDLVADVGKYQEFLPWCVGTRINWRKQDSFNADVLIGYKAIRETFTSTVTLTPNEAISVHYERGPFSKLQNYWTFTEAPDGCEIEFFIDFEFRSKMLSGLMEVFFSEAVRRMIDAFEQRARSQYANKN